VPAVFVHVELVRSDDVLLGATPFDVATNVRLRVDDRGRGRRRSRDERSDLAADMAEFLHEHERHERAAERHGDIQREEPAPGRAEEERARPLNPAQVELALAVNSVERLGQRDVGAEE
jgi:hypothetical protein